MPFGEVVFVPNPVTFNLLTKSRTGDVGKYLTQLGERIRLLAMKQVGKRTGRLATSIHVLWGYDAVGQYVLIGSDDKIALMHHNGTRPHAIFPRHANLLRFKSHGRIVYARMVKHPGTRPNHYLTDNLRKVIR